MHLMRPARPDFEVVFCCFCSKQSEEFPGLRYLRWTTFGLIFDETVERNHLGPMIRLAGSFPLSLTMKKKTELLNFDSHIFLIKY